MFNKWMDRIISVAKLQAFMYLCTWIGTLGFPIIHYLRYQERVYVVLGVLPFLDPETTFGYTINTCYHLMIGTITLISFYCLDLLFVTLLFTGAAYSDIVRLECDALTEELLKTGKERNVKKVAQLFRALLVRGQEMDMYVELMFAVINYSI